MLVTMTKAVENFADIGDILTYTVSFTGTGNTNANNVIFTDVIPTGTTFVLNSLTMMARHKWAQIPLTV